ncbi:MAG: hypothetical protein IT365_21575 [Candidatus Hydrogenedentes bacterium]|nr:hypothetical protein [Candidatus Hydrogenedentota bacterium]
MIKPAALLTASLLLLIGPGAMAQTPVPDVNETIAASGALFTYLLDTGTPSPTSYTSESIREKTGWTLVAEDDTAHQFQGDAILLNDSVAVVLRKGSSGADIYAKAADTYAPRAHLEAVDAKGQPSGTILELRVEENSPASVMVACGFGSGPNAVSTLAFRISTGQIVVEVQPRQGAAALGVRLDSEFLVIPDFFADDLVYTPDDLMTLRSGLPAENFLMLLASGGDAIATCVWPSREQHAVAIRTEAKPVRIVGADISFERNASVWVAFHEAKALWHRQPLPASAEAQPQALAWTPPFPARWRADFRTDSEAALSQSFVENSPGSDPDAGVQAAAQSCWFAEGQAHVRPLDTLKAPAEVIVYPIDRTQGTPLNVFCLVDIMRGTLGFGACQYVLDLEGLDAQSSPTPALVMEWIEKQVKAGRAAKSQDKIAQRLEQMCGHVEHADKRIRAYQEFARAIAQETGTRSDSSSDATSVARIGVIAQELLDEVNAYTQRGSAPDLARKEMESVMQALGSPQPADALAPVSKRLHLLGEAQDRALSKGRMAVRRIDQHALDLLNEDAKFSAFAQTAHERASRLLREPPERSE